MSKKEKIVIFDVDGTLSNCEHRVHHITQSKKDFKAFYSEMEDDTVNEIVRELLHVYLFLGYRIVIVTGRPEDYRHVTIRWLKENNITFHELHMRPSDKTKLPDVDYKRNLLKTLRETYDIYLAVEDRRRVVEMWRDNDVPCFQVDNGDF